MPKATPAELAAMVNKQLGANVVKLGNDPDYEVKHIQTGLLPIDILLQGGLPKGRFTMVVGDYSTLKTLIGLYAIKQVQEEGGTAVLIDTEHAYDPLWAKSIGIDTDALLVYPNLDEEAPDSPGEMAIDAAEVFTRAGVDLIVFDSIAATLPQTEQNRRLFDESQQMARLAALMSRAGRKLTTANKHTAFLWINQFRMNVGITFGNPQTITGGKAMPYYASHIIEMRKGAKITRPVKIDTGSGPKTIKETTGQEYVANITKSKLSKPFREVNFIWDLEAGAIDIPTYLIAQGLELGLIRVKGNTWSQGSKTSVGRTNFRKALVGDPGRLAALEIAVRNHHGIPLPAALMPTMSVPKPVAKRTPARRSLKK